ncbi:lambda-exonuclease family protein [Methylomonas sp. AM2-LC]|uniref:YqaJ viral recombinase family nuclease n=1 Tax=Methylomonas sp. AM2-LC TaxID=3153301 RepID=UPI003262D891
MKIIDISQRSQDWFDWRNAGVTASEADIVLGRSPYKTRYRLWAEKKGLILPDNLDSNPHVRRGIRLEPKARSNFEDRQNTLLLPVCAQSDQYPFMRASFDGIDDNGIPVEIKAPSVVNFRDAENIFGEEYYLTPDDYFDVIQNRNRSKLYQRYYPQIQQQIFIAGSNMGWLFLYLNDNEYIDIPVPRDDALINELILESQRFYNCLINNSPPERDLQRDIFIPEEGNEQEKWKQFALRYHQSERLIVNLKAQIADLEKEQAQVEEGLIELMGDFMHAECAGLKISRYLRLGRVDYKGVLHEFAPSVSPEDLNRYRTPSTEHTRVTVKDENSASVPYSMDEIIESTPTNNDAWF